MITDALPHHNQNSLKIKIDFTDDSGAKYSFVVEGSSKEKINKLIEFAESASSNSNLNEHDFNTNFSKLYGLLESRFRFGTFTSTDVLRAYQVDFNTPTTLSVISTYLARLARRGFLTRARHGSGWNYRLARTEDQREQMIKQPTPDELLYSTQIPP